MIEAAAPAVAGAVWTVGGYLVGTFPSTWLVARFRGATALLAASDHRIGRRDPHLLMKEHVGTGWTSVAATADVLKGFLFVLAARWLGRLPVAWLAASSMALVVGHAFPFYARRMSGRGLAAASGVLLVLLPVEMVVAGLTIVGGWLVKSTGLASTIGMASVPVLAAVQSQPSPFVAMGAGIFALILARRLWGIGRDVREGSPPLRAAWYRLVYDRSDPPFWGAGGERVPRWHRFRGR